MSKNAFYKAVRAILIKEIADGVYPVGEMFPTDLLLAQRFKTSRHTVREAVRGLQDAGLISRTAGSGTRVLARGTETSYSHTVDSLAELTHYVAGTHLERRYIGYITLSGSAIADLVGRPVGERWLRLSGVRWLTKENVPLCWTDILVAADYGDIRERLRGDGEPVYERICQHFGLRIANIEQQIKAVPMPSDFAEALGSDPRGPALRVRRHFFAEGATTPFEISVNMYPGDRYAHTMHVRREDRSPSAQDAEPGGDAPVPLRKRKVAL